MKPYGRSPLPGVIGFALLGGLAGNVQASVTVTGVANPKYLISGAEVVSTGDGVLKIIFENKTPGTNVSLCAGTLDDFAEAKCSVRLSGSGGPGFMFLTLIDAKELSGKAIYAIREVGMAPARFVLTIE